MLTGEVSATSTSCEDGSWIGTQTWSVAGSNYSAAKACWDQMELLFKQEWELPADN